MYSGLPNFALTSSQMMARSRIEASLNLPRLFAAIDADLHISGAGVVYIDADFNVVVLREFRPVCSIKPKRLILRETPRYSSPSQYIETIKTHPRESRIVGEATGMVLSCASAVIGWFVVFSGTVAVPFTAGASAVVTVIGIAAASASTAQCFAGVVRTGAEAYDPSFNDRLDGEAWYGPTMLILDGVSLLGVAATATTTLRLVRMKNAATGKSTRELLNGLSRQERRKLTDELLQMQHPGMTREVMRLRQLAGAGAGALPKRISNTQIQKATWNQIHDALGGALGVAGSLYGGNLKPVASIAMGLYEELDE